MADGVYLFVTPPYGDVGLDGNSTVIVSGDGTWMPATMRFLMGAERMPPPPDEPAGRLPAPSL